MRILRNAKRIGLTATALFGVWVVSAQNAGDPLEQGFRNPPPSARPRVWWHWMNGNITKEGIRADLEWMKRVGIGGFQNFDAALNTPQVVQKRLIYMTPEWKDAFHFAVTEADRLGLEMAIAGSPGWSESGGPWVPPAEAMKKFVWSETLVEGGHPFHGVLPKPPATVGPFQNIAAGRGGIGSAATRWNSRPVSLASSAWPVSPAAFLPPPLPPAITKVRPRMVSGFENSNSIQAFSLSGAAGRSAALARSPSVSAASSKCPPLEVTFGCRPATGTSEAGTR